MYLFEYRELIKNLVISDLKVKYQSSILGFAWSMLNPLLMMIILYFVFQNIFRFQQEHYALYLLIGIITWRFISIGTMMSMVSVVGKPNLVTKVYIPREVLTFSITMSAFISSTLEFVVLIPLMLILGDPISLTIFLFPLIHAISFIIVYGLSLTLAALYVYFRDLNQIWDIVLQIGFYASPIIYPLSMVPREYLSYYALNPFTCLITIYRNILLYGSLPTGLDFLVVAVFGLVVFVFGSMVFKRLSKRFAEEV